MCHENGTDHTIVLGDAETSTAYIIAVEGIWLLSAGTQEKQAAVPMKLACWKDTVEHIKMGISVEVHSKAAGEGWGGGGGGGHLRVALPSSTRPRRMSSNRAKLSAIGRSRQGLGSLFFLHFITNRVTPSRTCLT